ncbi:MAG: molybdate transport system permease protein [Halieaceae bacterium]
MTPLDTGAILLTLKLAAVSTFILVIIGTPVAWWLAQSRGARRTFVESVIALPLVLPPTVVGFYLLVAFSPDASLGKLWLQITGSNLAFTFSALVLGSVLYSMPFVIQPLQSAFRQVPKDILEAAATMGAKPREQFFSVVLPVCRRSFITAASLGFAHTVGEFGIVLMIGGNIPNETQVLSIRLYDQVESLQYSQAHSLAAGLLVFSFLLLYLIYRGDKQARVGFGS